MPHSLTPVPWTVVDINGGFWKDRQDVNRQATLPIQHKWSRSRIEALDLKRKPVQTQSLCSCDAGAAYGYDYLNSYYLRTGPETDHSGSSDRQPKW